MSETITFGAAQIPVTPDIDKNIVTIKSAIDWAEKENVNYLVTPEGSLSGYVPTFNEDCPEWKIQKALEEVLEYSSEKKVGLALGTKYKEGGFVYNQIRVYDENANFQGSHDKMYSVANWDRCEFPSRVDPITIKFKNYKIKALCLICNDLWGGYMQLAYPLLNLVREEDTKSHIVLHSSNGFRGYEMQVEDVLYEFHNSVLRWGSFNYHTHIITADNCLTMDGCEYEGRASSRSGIVYNGTWLTEEKNIGTQYFKVELDLELLTNDGYNVDPDEKIKKEKGIQSMVLR